MNARRFSLWRIDIGHGLSGIHARLTDFQLRYADRPKAFAKVSGCLIPTTLFTKNLFNILLEIDKNHL